MFEFGDKYLYGLRKGMNPIPGLIRMDRALIYIRQRLDRLIREVNDRTTKTLGESAYSVRRFYREAVQICSMSGDAYLAEQVYGMLDPLNSRTLRVEALNILRALSQKLDEYKPVTDSDDVESLRERIASLEEQLSEPPQQDESKLDTSEESSVFVIMPFRPEFNDVWKGGIQRAAQAEGFKPIRVDMINRSTNITDDIVNSIEKCHLAIIDVTDNNPNVMFELGYALAKDKPNIIISQSADYLPFDIRNIRAIVYSNTWSGIEDLKVKVQDFLREFSQKRTASTKKSSTAKTSSSKKAKKGSKQ